MIIMNKVYFQSICPLVFMSYTSLPLESTVICISLNKLQHLLQISMFHGCNTCNVRTWNLIEQYRGKIFIYWENQSSQRLTLIIQYAQHTESPTCWKSFCVLWWFHTRTDEKFNILKTNCDIFWLVFFRMTMQLLPHSWRNVCSVETTRQLPVLTAQTDVQCLALGLSPGILLSLSLWVHPWTS